MNHGNPRKMDQIFSSDQERQYLNLRKDILRHLSSSEIFSNNVKERNTLRTTLGFSNDEKRRESAPSFVEKVLLTSNDEEIRDAKDNEPPGLTPNDSTTSGRLLPRIFSNSDDAAILFGEKSLSMEQNQ